MPLIPYWLVGSFLVLNAVYSLPIDDGAIDYLRNYGYLPKTESRFGDNILHENTATNALKALQRIGQLEETGVLDNATKELLKRPRCGNPDFEITQDLTRRRRQKRYAVGPTKWNKLVLSWKFMNRNHPRDERETGAIRRLIYEAMAIWEHNSNLKLQESGDDSADILIDFARRNHGDNFDFDGPGGSLAHAFYPGSGIAGDVHLDFDESWDIEMGRDEGDLSFFYTLLHELGHSLGLSHSSSLESIMYPFYSSSRTFDRSKKELYDDDIIGIEQLYGPKPGKKWGPITPYKTTPRTTPMTPPPRTRPSTSMRTTTTQAPIPDKCNTGYDAIGIIRNELMIFKGLWMWRFRDDQLLNGYPVEFHRMWPELDAFDHIDAVFERRDGKFVFFHGQEVIVIDSNRRESIYNLEHLGFGRNVKKIDAIFRWGFNNKTYVFSENDFWKVDDNLRVDRNEKDYPRPIPAFWKNVRAIKIDTAFQLDGITYFFSDKMFYKFNDKHAKLEISKPQVSAERWMGCPFSEEEISSIQKSARVQNEKDYFDTSSTPETTSTLATTTISVFTILLSFLLRF